MLQNLVLVLWIILSIVILTLIILAIVVGLPPSKINTVQATENIPPCSLPIEQLPDVSTLIPCYEINLIIEDNQRYYDLVNDWTILSTPLNTAEQVCIQFCPQTQFPNECLNWDSTYQSCRDRLLPNSCSGSILPVAKKGSQFYYPIGRGRISCY
jgi:hypothetical protein